MAHGTNILHSIKLPNGTTYEIHDAHAVHTLEDMMNLGLSGAFIFKGTKDTVDALPATGNTVGDVWHVTENDSEYVWTDDEVWEEFGAHIVVDHTHNVTVKGTNAASAVTGSATVTGGNSSSSVSVPNAPKVSASAKYAKVNTGNDTFVKSYPGATGKMVTTSVTPAGAATSVISSVSAPTDSVTGVSGSTTASKATAGTALAGAKVGTAVAVGTSLNNGKVTAGSKGSAASWSANVTNGVLEFSFTANTPTTPTAVTLPTLGTTEITPAAALSIPQYTFSNVTVPVAATSATTVVTGVTTDSADVATVGTAVTVATGSVSSSGKGSSVMTGLGTAVTASALTSASLAAGTSSDGVHTGDDVTVETQTLSGTAAAQTWTQNTGTISGTAAAQVWTQGEITVSQPV